jgi:hypothetical protein
MSLIQSRYGIPSHWGLLAVVFSALLVLPFFNPSMASAQELAVRDLPKADDRLFMQFFLHRDTFIPPAAIIVNAGVL